MIRKLKVVGKHYSKAWMQFPIRLLGYSNYGDIAYRDLLVYHRQNFYTHLYLVPLQG